LHSATGFWLFGFVMIWAVSGVEFAFPQAFRRTVNAISPLTVFRAPQSAKPKDGAKPIDPTEFVAKAKELVPGAKIGRIVVPSNPNGAMLILMAYNTHGDFDTSDEVHLYFDQYSGTLLQRRDTGLVKASMGDTVMKWLGPIHIGSFGGTGVKVAW